MFGSIRMQAGLGLAAGCCLISSALAELGPEGDNPVAAVQEKQVGTSKKRPSSSQIIEMHGVVIESHPSDEEVNLACAHSSHGGLHDHQAQPLGSQLRMVKHVLNIPVHYLGTRHVSCLLT